MKNFLFMPDSFKGTLTAAEICAILQQAAAKIFPDAVCRSIPVADGGEGSVDCFLQALPGERISCPCTGPLFDEITAYYALIDDGRTAVIEMAAAAGLPMVENRRNPLRATTFGVGQLIQDALERGVERIILGLGGSATTDGGCGAAAALGVRFLRQDGQSFVPTGGTLQEIAHIDVSSIDPHLSHCKVVTMCDIDNPMYGPRGAAYIFGPQKGADEAAVKRLDDNLQHLAAVIEKDLGLKVAEVPGSGAGGAMGAGTIAFFGARLQSGIDTVLEAVHFEELARQADVIFTGEGRLDSQSLQGKVVIGIARRARELRCPVIAVVGGVDDAGLEPAYDQGVSAVFSINRLPQDFAVSRHKSRDNLQATAENIFRLLKLQER